MIEYVEITPGGKLSGKQRNNKGRELASLDLTQQAPLHLSDKCRIADGTTLYDVFLLINVSLDQFHKILGRACRELVQEGIQPSPKDPDFHIESLELYWRAGGSKSSNGPISDPDNYTYPEFHGIPRGMANGPCREVESEVLMGRAFALEFEKASCLASLPIRLRSKPIFDECEQADRDSAVSETCEYTFKQVLDGILIELSYFGPPAERDKKVAEFYSSLESREVESLEAYISALPSLEEKLTAQRGVEYYRGLLAKIHEHLELAKAKRRSEK